MLHFVGFKSGEHGEQLSPAGTNVAILVHEFVGNSQQGSVAEHPVFKALGGEVLGGDSRRYSSRHASPVRPWLGGLEPPSLMRVVRRANMPAKLAERQRRSPAIVDHNNIVNT
jgi:hypothetical protein